MDKAITKEADHPSTNAPPAVPKQATRSVTRRQHSYAAELVVGVIVMVVGSFLVWKLGIGAGAPKPVEPAPRVADDTAADKESIFTREVYAKIQPGLAVWNLEDILGPPHIRQPLPVDSGIKAIYNLPYDEAEDAAAGPLHLRKNEFEEMVWQSKKIVDGVQQHIAVLLKDGKVIARRSAGID